MKDIYIHSKVSEELAENSVTWRASSVKGHNMPCGAGRLHFGFGRGGVDVFLSVYTAELAKGIFHRSLSFVY